MDDDRSRGKNISMANNGSNKTPRDKNGKVGNAFKHGMRDTPEYKAWSEAKQRCHNPNNDKYEWYGARGISVCDEWRDDFMAFYNHIGPKPSRRHQIDRINNDKNYEPGNVQWVTGKSNIMNRRNTVYCVYLGERMLLERYAEIAGIPYATAWARMKKHPHMLDGEAPRRTGENNGNTKLTDGQVAEIRASTEPTKILSQRYGVSYSLIQGIRRGDLRRTIESTRRAEARNL
jgi:hypothetical protein